MTQRKRGDSFSAPLSSPVAETVYYSGKEGKFYRSVKLEGGGYEKEYLPGFRFVPLDIFISVSGWNDREQKFIWSNMIRNTKEALANDHLEVRMGNDGVVAKGVWAEIKEQVGFKQGKYTNVVIALTKAGTIVKVIIRGAALSPWFKLKDNEDLTKDVSIGIASVHEETVGSNTFLAPVYDIEPMDVDWIESANMAFTVVAEYFDNLLGVKTDEEKTVEATNDFYKGLTENIEHNAAMEEDVIQSNDAQEPLPF